MKWYDLQKQMRVGEALEHIERWESGNGMDAHYIVRTETGMEYHYDTHYSMAKFGVNNNPGHYNRGRVIVGVDGIFDEIPDYIMRHFPQLAA